jgi:hypothetical protein
MKIAEAKNITDLRDAVSREVNELRAEVAELKAQLNKQALPAAASRLTASPQPKASAISEKKPDLSQLTGLDKAIAAHKASKAK